MIVAEHVTVRRSLYGNEPVKVLLYKDSDSLRTRVEACFEMCNA